MILLHLAHRIGLERISNRIAIVPVMLLTWQPNIISQRDVVSPSLPVTTFPSPPPPTSTTPQVSYNCRTILKQANFLEVHVHRMFPSQNSNMKFPSSANSALEISGSNLYLFQVEMENRISLSSRTAKRVAMPFQS